MLNLLFWNRLADDDLIQRSCFGYFSQYGEDIAYSKFLDDGSPKGLIVDIGAYHPIVFSNTFVLHLQGWQCINVDANPESIQVFNLVRPRDTNLCLLVAPKAEERTYYKFEESAWNTAARDGDVIAANNPSNPLLGKETRHCVAINDLLAEYVGSKPFDALNIDVEGMDMELLSAIDFTRYRPRLISIELGPECMSDAAFHEFLRSIGYKLAAFYTATAILIRTHLQTGFAANSEVTHEQPQR